MNFLDQLLTPFSSAIIWTNGLPELQNQTRYEFNIQQSNGNWDVWLPGHYVGRDQIGEPHFVEQVDLLLKYKSDPIYGQGGFKFLKQSDYEDFILAILPFIVDVRILS